MQQKKLNKSELRAQLKERRASLDPKRVDEWNRAIVSHVARSAVFANADLLLLYAPKGSEPDLLALVKLARERGIDVAFPVSQTETTTLQFRILKPHVKPIIGAYGIPEPPTDAPVAEPTARTLCIVPGLAFAPNGSRIGYGKGYYDRFLADFPGVAVGALCEAMLCKHIPTEPHDLPVSYLFTERGTVRCADHRASGREADRAKNATPAADASKSGAAKSRMGSILSAWKGAFLQKLRAVRGGMPKAIEADAPLPEARPLHLPPVLVLVTFLLVILSRPIDAVLLDRDSKTMGVILLQILIFVVPAILYSRIKGESFGKRIRLVLPRIEHLWFLFCMLAVMITGSLLTCILTGGISSLTGHFTLYNTFTAQSGGGALDTVAIILAYAILPAFGEELIFRAYLCAEYEHLGVGVSIAASAIFFAMLHFSLPLLLTYLFLGALLAAVLYATRSLFAAMVLHALYNLFCLFGQPYLSAFYLYAGSNDIFLFCLITLFLLFAAFAVGEARKIYHVYAIQNRSSAYTTPRPIRAIPRALWKSLATPTAGACLAVWITMSLIDLLG